MGGRQVCSPIQRCCCVRDMHIYKKVACVEQALAVAPPSEHPNSMTGFDMAGMAGLPWEKFKEL